MKDLKQLETLRSKATQEMSDIDFEINHLREKRKLVASRVQSLTDQIKLLTSDIVVTEHAIVRYFERYLDYDIEEIKRKILPETIKESLKTLGECIYPVNGFDIKIKDNKVVTVMRRT